MSIAYGICSRYKHTKSEILVKVRTPLLLEIGKSAHSPSIRTPSIRYTRVMTVFLQCGRSYTCPNIKCWKWQNGPHFGEKKGKKGPD